MINYEILENLRNKIVAELYDYYHYAGQYEATMEPISGKNVVIGAPDEDYMNGNVMIYIIPDEEPSEQLTTSSYLNNWNIDIFILCKGKKRETLVKAVYAYYEALLQLLIRNQTIDGTIDGLTVTGHEFMPDVDGKNNTVAIRAGVTLVWCKDF